MAQHEKTMFGLPSADLSLHPPSFASSTGAPAPAPVAPAPPGQPPAHQRRTAGASAASGALQVPAATAAAEPQVDLRGHTVLYGGSFDPGHWGHVNAAVALVRAGSTAVWLMPAAVHADKANHGSFAARLRQCAAVAEEVDQQLPAELRGRVQTTDVEASVASDGQTVRVLQALHHTHPDRRFAFAMGADCLASAPTWADWPQLQALARIVVLRRPGFRVDHPDALAAPMLELSSTAVRQALAGGRPVAHMVPATVLELLAADADYAAGALAFRGVLAAEGPAGALASAPAAGPVPPLPSRGRK